MASPIMICPLCHNATLTIIARELRQGEKRKVFFCRRCELGILDSKIGAGELKKFYAAKYAARKCHCQIYTTDITETPLPKKYFDAIVAFQTLEHVANPIEFINTLKEYLKPSGVMMIEVPNLYDTLAYVYDLPNHYKFFFHAAHLWYFTARSLNKLMSDCDFKGRVHYQQDYNILNHFHWIQEDTPDPRSFAGLNPPHFPLQANISPKIKKALDQFIIKEDKDYKKILADLGITSNITFIGKVK